MKARDFIIALNEKYGGDWNKIYADIANANRTVDSSEAEATVARIKDKSIILMDDDYPSRLKQIPHPPFVLYYRGNLDLLTSKNYIRLGVVCSRTCSDILLSKGAEDLRALPDNVVLVVSNRDIIANCLFGEKKKKIILIKICGLDQKMPYRVSDYEEEILKQGGLIITKYPANVYAEATHFIEKNLIMGGICDNILVVDIKAGNSANAVIMSALNLGSDIMVYPTLPEWENTTNNSLIAQGALLVENNEDIKEILGL